MLGVEGALECCVEGEGGTVDPVLGVWIPVVGVELPELVRAGGPPD